MRNIIRISCLTATAGVLAACQSQSFGPPPLIPQPAPQRASIEGEWVDPNGIISSFRNGAFETRTSDSNSLLANGNYRYVNDQLVEIDLRSAVRQTNSTVNCAVVTPAQLNCTSDAGAQFSLVRRAMG